MRVALVCDSFAPAWGYGGPPRLVSTIATGLVGLGHDVSVITTDALDSGRCGRLIDDGSIVYRAANLSNRLAWERKVFLPILKPDIVRILKKADVVHLFQGRSVLSLVSYIVATMNSKPVALSPLGGLPVVGSGDKKLKNLYDWLFFHRTKEGYSAVLCQNSHEIEVCKNWGFPHDRIHLVPLCVDSREFEPLPERGGLLRQHPKLSEFEQIYTYLGRIHKYKGLDVLIRAFVEAFPAGDNALVIAGKDEKNVSQLKALVTSLDCAQSVFFPGPLYGMKKAEAFVDSFAFAITPIIYEETSLAALEAAACRLPVITTTKSAIPWLDESNAGVTVEPYVGDIARGLKQISNLDAKAREEMGARAKTMVEQHFSPDAVTRKLVEIYAQFCPDLVLKS